MEQGQRRVLAIALPLALAQRGQVARIVALSWGASVLAMLQPYFSKRLVDDGALAGDMRVLASTCAVMLVTPLIGLALESWNRFGYLELSSHVLFRLRERVFSHLQSLSPGYYSRVGFGDLVSRFDGDLAEVQRFVVDAPLALIGGLFNIVLLVVLMAWLSPLLAAVVLATVPLQLAATWWRRRGVEAATRAVRERAAALSSYFLDSLRAVKFIQSTNTEAVRLEGLRGHHDDYHEALRASQQASFVVSAMQRLSGTFAMALVIAAGAWLLMRHQTSVGVLVAFIAYAGRASGPVNTLLGVYSGWQRARVSLARVAEVLDAEPARPAAQACISLPPQCRGAVEFRAVTYRHEPAVDVLRDASFTIAAGSKIVLLGASGGGKSTIADLLRGHFAPQAGAIFIDGVDIAQVALADLRRRVAVVDQEPVFFPGTVADNLRYVRPGASAGEVAQALTQAGLDGGAAMLARQLGASSNALSRGERMRLALARAILLAPSILVLDETTSAVDCELARAIMASVDAIFAGRTRIVITHDRRLAGACDAVCLLRGGRLIRAPEDDSRAG
ncbi:MAG: ABC transporter ATP-binding protein [Rhodocyclaceae bacterium]|nr:ABC transporter ATP-binding protein [Rhodocyclaceae bacterium]